MTSKDYHEVGRKNPAKSQKSIEEVLGIFLHVKDRLDGEQIDLDLVDSLLTSEDINSEVDKVPLGFMFVSALAAFAEERHDNFKNKIKEYEGILDEQARDGEITARVTDAKAKAFVVRDRVRKTMMKKLNFYKRQQQIFEAAAKAFDIKKSMLQTKSANIRITNGMPEVTNPDALNKSIKKKKIRKKDA